MYSIRAIQQSQARLAEGRAKVLAAVEAAGERWGNRLTTETWHISFEHAVSTALRKFWHGSGAGFLLPDNTAPAEFAVVAGQYTLDHYGKIQHWCTTGERVFNPANPKAKAFDRGARRGFAAGLASQAAKLAASVEAYVELASIPYWHGLAKSLARRIAESGPAKFAAFEPLETQFVRWEAGGTYRHRCRLKFDRPLAAESGQAGHYRPGAVGILFGRGSSNKSGWTVQGDTVEVYQDQ